MKTEQKKPCKQVNKCSTKCAPDAVEQQHQPVERERKRDILSVVSHLSKNVLSHILSGTREDNNPACCYSLASALVK